MRDIQPSSVTVLLRRMKSGDRAAFGQLMDLIYPALRRIAGAYLRGENHERVLQPTALVNEAYLRLVAHQDHNWQNRAHFFGATARLMHRILIEHARARLADKRRGETVSLDEGLDLGDQPSVELLLLEEGLDELARISPRQAQVVEMRFFGGLTVEEVAECLGLTPRTVDRDWAVARAWLRRYLKR